ncbi:MAG: hypothetical protein COB07_02465 [Sulfurovum sp.]|nr:MAG: hypothetical protein COB07_07230 [Sulfurovum sp.]PHS41353.1 MAG: hypothetical protein COB07_02465 [Sulfurovum sp.]
MKYTSIALTALIFLAGCATNGTKATVKEVPKVVKKEKVAVPPKPKKEHELKEVEDTNFSDSYMYPESTVKKAPVRKVAAAPVAASGTFSTMNKEQCIAMISQEKFDKYATMFGSEAASIKRCQMIKATQH